MASYYTSSGFVDLVGTCKIIGNNVTSYTSNIRGAGTVTNLPGPNLNFRVSFPGVAHPFTIFASPNGSGFDGRANDVDGGNAEESWAATATAVAAGSGQSS